jgi:hypothetical protein
MVVYLCQPVFAVLPGGGVAGDPYRIESLAHFHEFAADPSYWNDNILLNVDLNLTGVVYTAAPIAPDETTGAPFDGTPFTGVFDANGHIIHNLTIENNEVGKTFVGLFGKLGEPAEVKNLGLENVNIIVGYNTDYIGSLAGTSNSNCTISNCYATGLVTGGDYSDSLGGLVGRNLQNGTIDNCYSTCSITVNSDSECIGGLVGDNSGTINRCYTTGKITAGPYSRNIGGLVGTHGSPGLLSECYSTGLVNVGGNSIALGGLAGNAGGGVHAYINNCYSTGSVIGGTQSQRIGGLVGQILNTTTISNCYSTGSVSAGNNSFDLGGLVGYDNNVLTVNSSYWNTETSGMSTSDGGTSKTTAQMMQQATYTSWDFDNIWSIYENASFPFFQPPPEAPCLGGVYPVGDVNENCLVDLYDLALLCENWLTDTRL